MGFIEETGAAQHYRDARIAAIYEGTNGIQANDLLGRKVLKDQGAAMRSYIAEILQTAETLKSNSEFKKIAEMLEEAATNLETTTNFVIENSKLGQNFVGGVAFNFLMMMGYVSGSWYMARSAERALVFAHDGDNEFINRKLASVRFYFAQLLPRHKGYMDAVINGADIGFSMNESNF
jgi:hypothetical protein